MLMVVYLKGISFWRQVFVRKVNGRDTAYVLVDTQGTFDNDTTMADNVRIFSMGALMSSFLINNVSNQISEEALMVRHVSLLVGGSLS